MTAPDADLSDHFVTTFYGNTHGWACFGYKPRETPNGRNERLIQKWFEWPREQDLAIAWIEDMAADHALYWSPLLLGSRQRTKGNALMRRWLKLDLDGPPADAELLAELRAIEVRSGRPGNSHHYVALKRSLPDREYHALARGLRDAIGGAADAKIVDNDFMRLPGSLNFRTTPPTLVTTEPGPRRVWDPNELRALIGPLQPENDVEGDDTGEHVRVAVRVPRRDLPRGVRDVLRRYADIGDGEGRHRATFHIVRVCRESDALTLDQTLGVIEEYHPPSVDKFGHRLGQQVEKYWNEKVTPRAEKPAEVVEPGRQTSWTLDDLMAAQFPVLSWAVDGFIPEGLTLLVSAPKIGKSYLTMNLALALVFAVQALGSLDVEPGEVLVIPLDDPSPRRMQQRLDQIMRAMPDKGKLKHELHLELDWPTLAEGGGAQLDEWLSEHPNCRMVVIDTLSRLRDAESRASSDPGKPDEQAMAEFKRIADKHRVAIVGTHHDRKAEGNDFLDMVSGNKKLTGGADTIVYLTRARNQDHAVAKITGRDVEERELALRFDHPLWVVSDHTPAELDMSDLRRGIVDHLREHGKATASDLAAELNVSYNTVNQRLFQMLRAGEVTQPGGKRTPYELPRAGA